MALGRGPFAHFGNSLSTSRRPGKLHTTPSQRARRRADMPLRRFPRSRSASLLGPRVRRREMPSKPQESLQSEVQPRGSWGNHIPRFQDMGVASMQRVVTFPSSVVSIWSAGLAAALVAAPAQAQRGSAGVRVSVNPPPPISCHPCRYWHARHTRRWRSAAWEPFSTRKSA